MRVISRKLPKTGDFIAVGTNIRKKGKIRFSLVAKLSDTEIQISLNKKCVETREEAINKLKRFSISRATDIFNSGDYKEGETRTILFSPCW